MDFTRRFGALAARRVFLDKPEATMEQEIEVLLQDASENDGVRDESAA